MTGWIRNTAYSSLDQDGLMGSGRPLGVPTKRRRFYKYDVMALVISMVMLGAGMASVLWNRLAWELSRDNGQLVVLGLVLSIMNICLASVAPTLFLLVEARMGPSTLQNYDGLLRNSFLATRLSFLWRCALFLMTVLPLGLSVAYKRFDGGTSTLAIAAPDKEYLDGAGTSRTSTYGMFTTSGMNYGTGISLFLNATSPFQQVTAALTTTTINPGQVYGYNVLLLSNESAAFLDMPHPDYVTALQQTLALTESWQLAADVYGTVATYNTTQRTDRDGWKRDFETKDCKTALDDPGGAGYSYIPMFNGRGIAMIDDPRAGNQSRQFLGITPAGNARRPCDNLTDYVEQYDVSRQSCRAVWTVTRGGILLRNATCEGSVSNNSDYDLQKVIADNLLMPGVWYMPTLIDFVGDFALAGNASAWRPAYFATALAGMLWSRITALNGAASPDSNVTGTYFTDSHVLNDAQYEQYGLMYRRTAATHAEAISYTRPTLRRDPLLLLVLAAQPALTLLFMLVIALLAATTPLHKGFNLVALLAGIDPSSLAPLAGAAFSGDLRKTVRLRIATESLHEDEGVIHYTVVVPRKHDDATTTNNNKMHGQVESGKIYH